MAENYRTGKWWKMQHWKMVEWKMIALEKGGKTQDRKMVEYAQPENEAMEKDSPGK